MNKMTINIIIMVKLHILFFMMSMKWSRHVSFECKPECLSFSMKLLQTTAIEVKTMPLLIGTLDQFRWGGGGGGGLPD